MSFWPMPLPPYISPPLNEAICGSSCRCSGGCAKLEEADTAVTVKDDSLGEKQRLLGQHLLPHEAPRQERTRTQNAAYRLGLILANLLFAVPIIRYQPDRHRASGRLFGFVQPEESSNNVWLCLIADILLHPNAPTFVLSCLLFGIICGLICTYNRTSRTQKPLLLLGQVVAVTSTACYTREYALRATVTVPAMMMLSLVLSQVLDKIHALYMKERRDLPGHNDC